MFELSVVKDEPGRRLVLQETGAFTLPPTAGIGCLVAAAVVFGLVPLVSLTGVALSGGSLAATLALGTIELLFGTAVIFAVWQVLNATRRVVLLAADAGAGDLRLEDRGFFGWPLRSLALRLEQITSASFEAVLKITPAGASTAPAERSAVVRLRLRFAGVNGTERSESFRLLVQGLDKREEAADLALRFAAACQLGYYEVTRSDPRQVTVELRAIHSGLMSRVPVPERRASYADDRVAEPARLAVAEERVPIFDPRTFPSEFRVTRWEPGVLVRLDKRMRLAVGCLPFSLLVLGGPLAYAWMTERGDLDARLAVSLFALIFGLALGGLALGIGLDALPRRVTIDWLAGRIRLWRPGKSSEMPTSDISAVELTCLRHTPSKGSPTYRCAVRILHRDRERGEERATTLLETRSFTSDPDTPYAHALPLATELAQSLRVPRRVTDYA